MQKEDGREGREWSSLEAESVWVADDCVGIHCESVENHSRVDEVLLHTLQSSIELLKPHHLGSAYNGKAVLSASTPPSTWHLLEPRGLRHHRARSTQEGGQASMLSWAPGDFGWGRGREHCGQL